MTGLDIGFDLGTTVTKAAAFDPDGILVAQASTPTTWSTGGSGFTWRKPDELFSAIDQLLHHLGQQCAPAKFRSIGFTGMGETGSIVLGRTAISPLIAWFDPRGTEQIRSLPTGIGNDFSTTTGLPQTELATIAKLLWLRDQGAELGGVWLSVPELAVWYLGGETFAEPSLLGRTGLYDIHAGQPWQAILDALGVGADFVPPIRAAGTRFATIHANHPVAQARGAVLTVAGHDHLVAAAAVGAAEPGTVLDSFGTAEAFVGAAAQLPSPEQVSRLVELGLTVYPHVIRGVTALLAGTKSGVVLGRVLRLLGASTPDGRADLDQAAFNRLKKPAGDLTSSITVNGTRMSDHTVTIVLDDDCCSPEELWVAALEASTSTARAELNAMRLGGIQLNRLILAGGWSQMASLAEARRSLGIPCHLADITQPGLLGAAKMAAWAAEQGSDGITSPRPDWFTQQTS